MSGAVIKWSQGTRLDGLGCDLCRVYVSPVRRTSPSTCRLFTLVGPGVSPCSFSAEGKTVLVSQSTRVEESLGVYYSGFIQTTNKQTNKRGSKCINCFATQASRGPVGRRALAGTTQIPIGEPCAAGILRVRRVCVVAQSRSLSTTSPHPLQLGVYVCVALFY